ncbi:MAG: polyketide synthase dehydratase domain-containing protein, partial [Candidatus Competibacteraceae bacterium]|nr:polyketide synthase dehydratase domain-containing protein [Candidatus Competibacteraceae bacterium]
TLEQPITGLRQVTWLRPVTVGDEGQELRLTLKQHEDGLHFTLADAAELTQVYSRGMVLTEPPAFSPPHDLATIRQRCPNRLDRARIYTLLTEQGVDYGPCFQQLETLWHGPGEVLAELRPQEIGVDGWLPTVLDAALQSLMGIFLAVGQAGPRLPHTFSALNVYGELSQARCVHVQASAADAPCNLWLLDAQGQVILALDELTLRVPKDHNLQTFLTLEELGRLELLAFFQQAGFWQRSGAACTEAQLRQRLKVSPQHQRLLAALIAILEGAGLLVRRNEVLVATSTVDAPEWQRRLRDRARLAQELAERQPAMIPHLQLLQRCLAAYPALLRGEQVATEVFFPDGSLDQVEGIYRGHELADHFHTVLARELRSAVEAWITAGEPAPIRILEIGAGTGGTTGHVLHALTGLESRVELIYTDISPRFTQHGQRRFGNALLPIHFQTLDIERDPLAQGFTPDACHLVLASNVLHATQDIAVTLGHVRRLLRPGGRLLINEMTASRDFATLTFGLLDGWWRATDSQRRLPHSPLFNVAGWRAAFREAGFTPIAAYGEPGVSTPEHYQQSVLVGELPALATVDPARAPALEELIAHTLAPVPLSQTPPEPTRAPVLFQEIEKPDSPLPGSLPTAIETVISEVVAEVFEMSLEQVRSGRVMNFTDFGADSILSAELVTKLNARLGLNLKTTVIFNYPGIRELTGHLHHEFGAQLQELLLVDAATPPDPAPPTTPALADEGISLEILLRRLEAGELDYATALAQFPGELLEH